MDSTTTKTEPAPSPAPAYDWSKDVPAGSEKMFESFKGKPVGDVFKSYVESQKSLGGSIRIPKADAKPEEKAKAYEDIYKKLGRPEAADKYDLKLPEIHEDFKFDDTRMAEAKAAMFKAGFTNEQANTVMQLFANEIKSFYPDHSKVAAENRSKLIEELGSETAYTREIAYAEQAVRQFGGDEFMDYLDKTGLGNHPAMVKFASKIGRELAEHGAMEPADPAGMTSKADAEKKIAAVMNDKNDPYWSRDKAGHKDRVEEVQNWFKIAAGEI